MFSFHKYEATGNDFVMIDDRDERFPLNDQNLVAKICDRHFGVGADGLILIRNKEGLDFEMIYFNADGNLGSFCGNGGRAVFLFAHHLNMVEGEAQFQAYDGLHQAHWEGHGIIALKMSDVSSIEQLGDHGIMDTGSPHWIEEVQNLEELDVVKEGRNRRNSDRFREEGINVNFIEACPEGYSIRTYERGVEDETLACGTGITASALYIAKKEGISEGQIEIQALGGDCSVRFRKEGNTYTDIWLVGPAKKVFSGNWEIS